MPILTLAFLFRDNKILLAMKKRGFGSGKWNGYGGKLHENESPNEGIIREIKEESNVDVIPDKLQEIGLIDFYFVDNEDWDQKVIVYRVDEFSGEPIETDEMMPKWFEYNDIPWNEMWVGDDQWLPKVIEKKNFIGETHFTDTGKKVIKCIIN